MSSELLNGMPSGKAPMTVKAEHDVILADTFGAHRRLPASYLARSGIVEELRRALTGEWLAVVHGGQKLGKTTLLRHLLNENEAITIQCSVGLRRQFIYRMILSHGGLSVNTSTRKSRTKGISAEIGLLDKRDVDGMQRTSEYVTLNLSDIGDVARVMEENDFTRFIILNDFHNLSKVTQRKIACDLKYVLEFSRLRVIIVGCWYDKYYMQRLNPSLAGRIYDVHVLPWQESELMEVVDLGARLLQLRLSDDIKKLLIRSAHGCIADLHLSYQYLCRLAGVWGPSGGRELIDVALAEKAIRETQASASTRFERFALMLSEGFSKERRVALGPILARCFFQIDPAELLDGLPIEAIAERVAADTEYQLWLARRIEEKKENWEKHYERLYEGRAVEALVAQRSRETSQIEFYKLVRFFADLQERQVDSHIHPLLFMTDQDKLRIYLLDRSYCAWWAERGKSLMICGANTRAELARNKKRAAQSAWARRTIANLR